MKYVLTGGPCCGKSTQVNSLKEKGYLTICEAAELYFGLLQGSRDPQIFGPAIYNLQKQNETTGLNVTFLDRSLIDHGIAYPNHFGTVAGDAIEDDIFAARYSTVFFLEMLPEHLYYADGTIRTESYAQAKALEEKILAAYEQFGCDIVFVPFDSVENRERFMLAQTKTSADIEKEQKFASSSQVLDRMKQFRLQKTDERLETNYVLDAYPQFSQRPDTYIRLREFVGRRFEVTLKDIHFNGADRYEKDVSFTPEIAHVLKTEGVCYCKHRQVYTPIGNPYTEICLDNVFDLGEFVEVEAKKDSAIALWKKRLGLADLIQTPYFQLMTNSLQ